MTQTFTIPGRLSGLNEYTRACRSHWSVGADMKKNNQEKCVWAIRAAKLRTVNDPVRLSFHWIEKDNRRDHDNCMFAQKFVLDALVHMKILPDDSRRYVQQITHSISTDKADPRIEVEIEVIEDG